MLMSGRGQHGREAGVQLPQLLFKPMLKDCPSTDARPQYVVNMPDSTNSGPGIVLLCAGVEHAGGFV